MTKASPGMPCSVIPEAVPGLGVVCSGASDVALCSLPFPVCLSSVLSRAIISNSTLEAVSKRGRWEAFLANMGLLQEDITPDRLPDAKLERLDGYDLVEAVLDEAVVVISGSLILVSILCRSHKSCSG